MRPEALKEMMDRPIPDLSGYRTAKIGYRGWEIDTTDPVYTTGLMDLRTQSIPGINFYTRVDNPPYFQSFPGSVVELLVREEVARALQGVEEELEACGFELFVHDAWRPATIQHYMHSVWAPSELRRQHPEWADEQIAEEVNTYWAYGPEDDGSIDPHSPPPHSTGAAVDLTIRSKHGDAVWMGTAFDDLSERSYTDYFEREGIANSPLDAEAQKNRRLLYWLMREAGFVNNPTEWWHYSLGDQLWAKLRSYETGETIQAYYSNILPNTVG